MSDEKTLTPSFTIKINGSRLSAELEAKVKQIIVTDRINSVSKFKIYMSDPDEKLQDDSNFDIGSEVKISMGFKDNLEEIFTGEITGCEADFAKNTDTSFIINGRNKLHRLCRGMLQKEFSDKSESDAIKDLASDKSLDCDIAKVGKTRKKIMVVDQTPFDFIMDLAERYDCYVGFKKGKMLFKKYPQGQSEDVVLEGSKTLLEFYGTHDTEYLINEVRTTGFNIKKREKVKGEAKLSDISELKNTYDDDMLKSRKTTLTDMIIDDDKSAEDFSKDYLARNVRRYITAGASCEGNNKILAGTIVKINEMTGRYSQKYFVRQVCHTLERESYVTEMDMTLYVSSKTQSDAGSEQSDDKKEDKQGSQAAQEQAKEEKTHKINNLKWKDKDDKEIDKAHVGDKVKLTADVSEIEDGTTVNVYILEKDDDGENDEVVSFGVKVKDQKIEKEWEVVYMEDDDDTDSEKEKEEKGYTLPEYIFKMECNKYGVDSGESGKLEINGWIKTKVIDEETGEVLKNAEFRILFPDGSTKDGKTDENGCIDEKEIEFTDCIFIFKKKEE